LWICSVGGGGNTSNRRNKIEEKNKRLGEQRIRKTQEEEKAKFAKAAKKAAGEGADETGIHPSRRHIVPGS
jgi:nucleolar protein 6